MAHVLSNNSCTGYIVRQSIPTDKLTIILFKNFIEEDPQKITFMYKNDNNEYIGTIPGKMYMKKIIVNNENSTDLMVSKAMSKINKAMRQKSIGHKVIDKPTSYFCKIDDKKYDKVKDKYFDNNLSFIDSLFDQLDNNTGEMQYHFKTLGEKYKKFTEQNKNDFIFVPNLYQYPVTSDEQKEIRKIVFDVFFRNIKTNIMGLTKENIPILKKVIEKAHEIYELFDYDRNRYEIRVNVKLNSRINTVPVVAYLVDKNMLLFNKFTYYNSIMGLDEVISRLENNDKLILMANIYPTESTLLSQLCSDNINYRYYKNITSTGKKYFLIRNVTHGFNKITDTPTQLKYKTIIDGYNTNNKHEYCSSKISVMYDDGTYGDIYIKDISFDILNEGKESKLYDNVTNDSNENKPIYEKIVETNEYKYYIMEVDVVVKVWFKPVSSDPYKIIPVSFLEKFDDYQKIIYPALGKVCSKLTGKIYIQQWYVNIIWNMFAEKNKIYKSSYGLSGLRFSVWDKENRIFVVKELEDHNWTNDAKPNVIKVIQEINKLIHNNDFIKKLLGINIYINDDMYGFDRFPTNNMFILWARIKMEGNLNKDLFFETIKKYTTANISIDNINDCGTIKDEIVDFFNRFRDGKIPSIKFPTDMRHITDKLIKSFDELYECIYYDNELYKVQHIRYMNYINSDLNAVLHINITPLSMMKENIDNRSLNRTIAINRIDELLGRIKLWETSVIGVDHTKRDYNFRFPIEIKHSDGEQSEDIIKKRISDEFKRRHNMSRYFLFS